MRTVTSLDLIVIGCYLLLMLLVSVLLTRRVKDSKSFYMAGNSISTFVMMATACATMVGGSSLMGRAALGFTNGIECLMTVVAYMLGMFVFSAIAGKIHDIGQKHKLFSIPALFEYRFGKTAKLLVSMMIVLAMVGSIAAQISATATVIKLLGSSIGIPYELGTIISTVMFILYTGTSGLFGVVYTDAIQFFVLLAGVYILIPVSGIGSLGGLGNFIANIDSKYIVPNIDGRVLGDIASYFVFTMAGADMWQRAFAAKTRKVAKRGLFFGTLVYGGCMVMVFGMALLAQQLIPDVQQVYGTADAVVPALAVTVLPAGLTGLAIAGMLSVMMSTADSSLLVAVQASVDDIWKSLRPNMSERQNLRASRLMTVLLAACALVIALYVKSAYGIVTAVFSFYSTSVGACAFAAIFWEKLTRQGALASIVGGFFTCAVWRLAGPFFGIGATLPGIAVSFVLMVAVSLATYRKSPGRALEK